MSRRHWNPEVAKQEAEPDLKYPFDLGCDRRTTFKRQGQTHCHPSMPRWSCTMHARMVLSAS